MTPSVACSIIAILLAGINIFSILGPMAQGHPSPATSRAELIQIAHWRGFMVLGMSVVLVLVTLGLCKAGGWQ